MHYTSNLLKYIKISFGLDQTELAKTLNCKRSKISNVENGKSTLKLEEYKNLLEFFNVRVDKHFPSHYWLDREDDPNAFGISRHLGSEFHSFGRIASIFREYFIYKLGKDEFDKFCIHHGYSPIYFVNRNNPVQFRFNMEIVKRLEVMGIMRGIKGVLNFANYSTVQNPSWLSRQSLLEPTGIPRVEALLNNMPNIEMNHEYEVLHSCNKKSSITFSFRPSGHKGISYQWKKVPSVGEFMETWIANAMNGATLSDKFKVEFLERYTNNFDRTICKISGVNA